MSQGFADGIWAKLADQARVVEMETEVKKQYIRVMETEIDKRAQLNYAREQGRTEGKTEGVFEVASKMKSMGMPVLTICEATGLSAETVVEL